MAYSEDVNVNLNVLTGTMAGVTAILGGMSALTSSFGAMGTTASETFGTLDGLLVTSTALITTFGVKAAEAFGEFEQGMKIVQTVSGQTGYAINELSSRANELSVSYRTAIGDITTGLQTLGRAGLNSATTQMEVLESGLQTAKLEGRNLNGVLEEIIQNTAMLGGNLKSVDFGNQADYLNSLMVGTSMTAPIDSHDISQTLQYAGGTAAAAGANLEDKEKLEDLMGTVAAFAQKGVKGSMAGTSLRAFFTKPASQDKSVTEGLDRIGLTADDLWEDGGNSMKKVSDQIGIIQRQMDSLNLSTMDQVEIWGKIVGPKMGQQMMKLDSSSIKELTRDIQSAKSAEELSQKTLHTYTQKLAEMQQQGELAFREFGAKTAALLTPVVEVISTILGLLSNPFINTVAFFTVGAVLYHGLRKAWVMAKTLFSDISNLLSATTSEVTRINALAGESSTGFSRSASSVEFLNSKLAQTNTQLAAMQAQFMKLNTSKTGSAVMPLGIVGPNGKVPSNMIGYAPQDVIRMGGLRGSGRFYDPNESEQFKKDFREQINKETQDKVNKEMAARQTTGPRGAIRYRGEGGRFVGEAALRKELTEKFAPSKDEINKRTADALKSGSGKLHSGLMSMTGKEYKAFMNDLKAASVRLNDASNYGKGSLYQDKYGNYTQAYHRDMLKDFNRTRQLEYVRNAHKEGNAHINKVGGQTFYRANQLFMPQERMYEVERTLQKQAQLRQFEEARAANINRQKALAQGRGAGFMAGARQNISNMGQRGFNFWEKKMNQYGLALDKARVSLLRWGNQLDTTGVGAQTKLNTALDTLAVEIQEVPMTFEEALIRLSEMTNFTAVELEQLLTSETELSIGFQTLNDKLIALGLTTVEGEVAEAMHTSAVLADTAATESSAASKVLERLTNGAKSAAGMLGGPFMMGMMAITFIIQGIQKMQQDWQEKMQQASNQLSEAADKMNESTEKTKEIFSKENSNMSEANLDKVTDMQYGSVYDAFYQGTADRSKLGQTEIESDVDLRGSKDEETGEYKLLTAEEIAAKNEEVDAITLAKDENVKALQDNTMQLASATAAYNQAQNKEADAFKDDSWGFEGFATNVTDRLGEWQEEIWNTGAWLTVGDARAGFLDNNSPILTGSQSDTNYGGSTEFGAIFAADIYRFDDERLDKDDEDRYLKPLQQFFGSDFDRIVGLMSSMDNKISNIYGTNLSGRSALYSHAANMAGMDENTMALAQMSLKNNKEDYQRLGKQMFRYEQSRGFTSGRTAYNDYSTISKAIKAQKSGDTKTYNKAMKKLGKDKLTVQDRNLDNTIKKLMALTDNKLTYQNVLALGQLQQLQDMYQVANEQVAPGIMQTVQGVYDNVSATGVAGGNAGNAAGGAISAANNAAAIATFLGAQAQETAEHSAFNEYSRMSEKDLQEMGVETGMDETQFRQKLANLDDSSMDGFRKNVIESLAGSGWSVNNPEDATPENIKKNSERLYNQLMDTKKPNATYQDMLNTVTTPLVNYMQGAVMAAYDQSDVGEYGGGQRSTGSGQGGSGGDKDKDKDKDSGTRKERVDLVLCNKKEIPKLNVNLFKKPPNFTILNKNFKLRDIKINSQDKPKAIMNAIKNGIIETQKRMDPKIIQDDAAEFDPLDATEGSSVPKGKTKTTT